MQYAVCYTRKRCWPLKQLIMLRELSTKIRWKMRIDTFHIDVKVQRIVNKEMEMDELRYAMCDVIMESNLNNNNESSLNFTVNHSALIHMLHLYLMLATSWFHIKMSVDCNDGHLITIVIIIMIVIIWS